MRPQKQTRSSIVTAAFALTFVIAFSACDSSLFSVAPDLDPKERAEEKDEFQILSFGDVQPSLAKNSSCERYIRENSGGHLQIINKIPTSNNGEVKLNVRLNIQKESIPDDCRMRMSIDDEQFLGDLAITFGPHGTVFSKPALLDIYIENIDLTGMDPNKIKVYYFNPESGSWTPMRCDYISVDIENGIIAVGNAYLPHFSRYALSRG